MVGVVPTFNVVVQGKDYTACVKPPLDTSRLRRREIVSVTALNVRKYLLYNVDMIEDPLNVGSRSRLCAVNRSEAPRE